MGLLAGLVGYSCWRLGALPEIFPRFALQPSTDDTFELLIGAPLAAAVVVVYSMAIAVVLNRFGLRRSWSYLLLGIAFVSSLSLAASHFFGMVLLALPLLFSGGLTVLLVQVSRLWRVDRLVTRTLFTSPNGTAQKVTDANTRLLSGLKLLNTVLPM
jgi:hypothetical protein